MKLRKLFMIDSLALRLRCSPSRALKQPIDSRASDSTESKSRFVQRTDTDGDERILDEVI